MSTRAQTGGTPIGLRHSNKQPRFDPTQGRNYRTGVTLEPEDAVRLIEMAERAGMSVSGLLNHVFKNALINPATDLPFGIKPVTPDTQLFEEAS